MSSKLPRIGSKKLIRALERAGFEKQRQRGSHLHMRRTTDKKRVTIPVHSGHTIPTGTLRAILRDADLTVEELIRLL